MGGDAMLSVEAIREKLRQVLSGSLSHDDFEDWIVAESWNMHQRASAEVQELVGAIELCLAEHSDGHLDDDDLLSEFRSLLVYGCVQPPIQAVFFTIADATQTLVTLTSVADGPDYRFRLERAQTSPLTRTASARSVLRERVKVA